MNQIVALNLYNYFIYFIYRVHKPQVRGYSILPRRSVNHSPFCINWIINEEIEIIEGKIGRTIDNHLSRLCKSVLAKDYINLCLATKNSSTFIKNEKTTFYDSLKDINTNYIAAKRSLMLAFKSSNFGTWVQKPEELKTFQLNVCNY